MNRAIILDSSPLALLIQRQRIPQADACRAWMKRHVNAGTRVLVPEIVRYELRRELLRLRKDRALAALDIDVILAAQVLNIGMPELDFVVASSNVKHLSEFVPAEEWNAI